MTDTANIGGRNSAMSAFLKRRLRAAALGVVLPLLALTVIALTYLQANRDSSAYSRVFHQLGEAVHGVEIETYRATVLVESRSAHVIAARRHFINMLTYYGALRMADHNGAAPQHETQLPRGAPNEVKQLFNMFGVDHDSLHSLLEIDGAKMPQALMNLWESDGWKNDNTKRPPLETGIAWFILAIAPVFMHEEPPLVELQAGARAAAQISDFVIRGQLEELAIVLEKRNNQNAVAPIYIVLSICVLILIALVVVNFRILRPAEREIGLIQDALVEAHTKAQESDRAKSEFLASMSHEIRTPMNGVIAMSELLVGTQLDGQQRMFAETIHASGRSLLGIINDILDFSKIDAGRLDLDPKPFKLRQIAQEPGKLLSVAAAQKGVELLIRIDQSLPDMAVGDVARIRQIVVNLASNAIKFTDSGQVLIDVAEVEHPDTGSAQGAAQGLAHGSASGPEIRVEVRDTGCGIPEDSLVKVFEMFTQVDGSYARTHEGTGLGLAISKGLIDLMGGQIGVESKVGVGSTFWFTIPLGATEKSEATDLTTEPKDIQDKRVLVIDDNESNRLILHELLDSWRMDESAVASAREGLRKLVAAEKRRRPYDLVILDHHMPGMTGGEMLKIMRNTPEIADTPVIMLSSMDVSPEVLESYGARPDAMLTKPATSSDLLDRIVTVLAQSAARLEKAAVEAIAALGADNQAEAKPETSQRSVPKLDAAAAATAVAAKAAAAEQDEDAEDARSRDDEFLVLIVDDNAINRRVAASVLKIIDIAQAEARDGLEAVEFYIALRPNVVLMDISMPGMNGYDATAEIRRIEHEQGLTRSYIVGLTAHAMSGDREKCLEADMDDYIAKPVATDALNEVCQAQKAKLMARIAAASAPQTQALQA